MPQYDFECKNCKQTKKDVILPFGEYVSVGVSGPMRDKCPSCGKDEWVRIMEDTPFARSSTWEP